MTTKPCLKYFALLGASLTLLLTIGVLNAPKASATYQHGRLIDDSVFLDARSMSATDIQTFLVGKNAGLKDMKFTLSCYGSGSTERQLYTSAGAKCDTPIPASEIIYYAAQIYGVSPKVILATMQKEQSLTTAPNPASWQLSQAMGYACPTSGSCSDSSTFSYQVDSGTWALRYHYERAKGNMSWWTQSTSWTCGTAKPSYYLPNLYPKQNVNFVDPYSGVQYATVYIENAATSAFYCYTPHVFNNHTNSPHPNEPKGSSRCYSSHPVSGDRGRCYTGSYNFVYFFDLWFGSSQSNIPYAWSVVGQESYGNPERTNPATTSSLAPGQTVYLRIKARNTGYQTWKNSGDGVVRVGTNNPQDRISGVCTTGWLTCNRPASLIEASVLPGDIGTFEFPIKAQSNYGSTKEYFSLLAEGKSWMNDQGMHWQLDVKPPTFTWAYEGQAAYADAAKTRPINPGMLATNTNYHLILKARNTGNAVWTNSGNNPINLGTSSPLDRQSKFCNTTWLNCTRPISIKESSVQPGEIGTFEFQVTTPSTIGNFSEYFRPVVEGVGWMNDLGNYWQLNTRPNTYEWQMSSQAIYSNSGRTAQILPGQNVANGSTVYATLKAVNTGNTTWDNTSPNPVNLGTSNLKDRFSTFCDSSSWLSCNRATTLKESSVAPGQVGTFEFALKIPYAENGSVKKEYFTPLSEGKMWMNDIGMYYEFNFNSPLNTWQYVSQGSYVNNAFTQVANTSSLSKNTVYYLQLKAMNTSGKTWSKSITNLGTNNPQDRMSVFCNSSWPSCNRAASLKEANVAPGQTGTFEFSISTPSSSGSYNEYFKPVIEGQSWMLDVGLFWNLTVQ